MEEGIKGFGKVPDHPGGGAMCGRGTLMASITVESLDRSWRFEGLMHNVSHRGIGFYTPELIPVGRDVVVNICCSPGSGLNWVESVKGTVRWCKQIGEWYGAGVEFKDLDPEQQSLLISYIDSILRFNHAHPYITE